MGVRWLYICFFFFRGMLFHIARRIFVVFPTSFFSIRFVNIHVVHPYCRIDTTSAWIKLYKTILIIKGFRTIVFTFIVIAPTFQLIYPPAFFRCLSNSGTFAELRTTSFIEFRGVACSDSVSHNVQVLSIPVLLLVCCQDWTCNLQMIVSLEAYAMSPAGQFRGKFWDLWTWCSYLTRITTIIYDFFYLCSYSDFRQFRFA